jgi:hypothetical protein
MRQPDEVKCNGCYCWRNEKLGYKTDKLGRRNLTCLECASRTKRRPKNRIICAHGHQLAFCSTCPRGGGAFCEHGSIRHRCFRCGGAGICEHKRQRRRCKFCLANAEERKEQAAKQTLEQAAKQTLEQAEEQTLEQAEEPPQEAGLTYANISSLFGWE